MPEAKDEPKLVEIGPRFCMQPVKLFDDFLGGETLWASPTYVAPGKMQAARVSETLQRRRIKRKAKDIVKQKKFKDRAKEGEDLFSKSD